MWRSRLSFRASVVGTGLILLAVVMVAWTTTPAPVPARVPPDQVPDHVNNAGIHERLNIGSSIAAPRRFFLTPVPARIPWNKAPRAVHKVSYTEVVTVSLKSNNTGTSQSPLETGTVTLSYGFYWYRWNPWYVAVAGYARTQTDFCAQRLYARAALYRDVEHTGNWEYMEMDESEARGSCVTDSGEALTGYWTAPNGTDWKDKTLHTAQWDDNSQSWARQKVDSFP